jgi:hypothetical protein
MAKKMYRTEAAKGPLMRLSYAQSLRKGRENDKGVVKYGCTLILPKSDTAGMALLQKMVAEVVKGEWGDKGVERFKNGLIKNPLIPGDGKEARNKESGEINPGLGADMIFIRPTANEAVKVFNKAVQPASDDEIVSGYWGYPVLNAYAWHHETNGDGVSFGISMVQIVKEDEPLGGSGGGDPGAFFQAEKIDSSDSGASLGAGGAGDMFS